MMLALHADVLPNPFQVIRPKTDDAVTALPFQRLLAFADLLIDLVRGSAFDLANEFADRDSGGDGHCQVDMVVRAADFVNECAGSVDDFLTDAAMRFDFNWAA